MCTCNGQTLNLQGFVSVSPTSIAGKDKVDRYEIKLTQGLAVSLHAQHAGGTLKIWFDYSTVIT
jgi:hypothetical protein